MEEPHNTHSFSAAYHNNEANNIERSDTSPRHGQVATDPYRIHQELSEFRTVGPDPSTAVFEPEGDTHHQYQQPEEEPLHPYGAGYVANDRSSEGHGSVRFEENPPDHYGSHSATQSPLVKKASSFHDFDNVEEPDADLMKEPEKRRHWWQKSHLMYYLDLLLGMGNLSNIWRFPAVALALSLQWDLKKIGLLNFLIPYTIVSAAVGWPILVAELGIAQVVKGAAPRSFGSLGNRCRAPGLSWLMSFSTAIVFASLAAYAFVYTWDSPLHMANYYSAKNAASLSTHRVCTKYGKYIPAIQPLLCQKEGRLDLSCLDRNYCQLWHGNGRCIAVPWAPAADYLMSNARNVDPLLDNDHPQYCAARHLHDISTNKAVGVMVKQAYWRDYGKFHHFKLIVAFVVVWMAAAAFCFAGEGFGRVLRLGACLYSYSMLLILLVFATVWFWQNKWVSKKWLAGMFSVQGKALLRPEIWGAATVQVLFSLGLGTNQLQTKAARASSERNSIVWSATFMMLINSATSYVSLWIVWLAYGAASSAAELLVDDDIMYGTVRYDVRNMPYGQLFTSIQTMFDNSRSLDGTTPRHWFLSLMFWLAITIFGVNGVYQSLDAIVEPLYRSSLNWSLNYRKWVSYVVITIFLSTLSIILWYGCSWGLFIISQHFLLNFALPVVVFYEVLAIGWLFGGDARVKHFGSLAFWLQTILYFSGCCVAAFCTVTLYDRPKSWQRWVGFLIGTATMVSSAIFPAYAIRDHDVYGRKNTIGMKIRTVVYGSVEHLRKELNYRSCHTAYVMKLTMVWSLLIKYVCPFALLLAWGVCLARPDQNRAFSPYRPFYNDQNDIFSNVEKAFLRFKLIQAPALFIILGWLYPFFLVVLIPCFFFAPNALHWMVPIDTDPNFFNVRRAVEVFASSPAQEQVPVRLRETNTGNLPPQVYQSKATADKMPSFTPSRSVMIDPPTATGRDRSLADSPSEFKETYRSTESDELSPFTGGDRFSRRQDHRPE